MEKQLIGEAKQKAEILTDALPYIRDFNHKIVVIEYGVRSYLSPLDEQSLMQDIALLKTVGMKPIVVHDTPMGMDKFRENKRIAKLIELCGTKAIGICGVDLQTLRMTLDNEYIPVIVPNDIDNEDIEINPMDTALSVAVQMKVDKLVYLSSHRGIWTDETKTDVYSKLTILEIEDLREKGKITEGVMSRVLRGIEAVDSGVNRVHILDGRMRHALLLEFFGVKGVGTIIISDINKLYAHELDCK